MAASRVVLLFIAPFGISFIAVSATEMPVYLRAGVTFYHSPHPTTSPECDVLKPVYSLSLY